MSTNHVYDDGKIHVFDGWMSIDMGAKIHFEPLGMWMQRVWQSRAPYVCTGIKKSGENSGMNGYDYRFTRVGIGSIGNEFRDITLRSKDVQRWYDEGKTDELEIPTIGGYIMFDVKDL